MRWAAAIFLFACAVAPLVAQDKETDPVEETLADLLNMRNDAATVGEVWPLYVALSRQDNLDAVFYFNRAKAKLVNDPTESLSFEMKAAASQAGLLVQVGGDLADRLKSSLGKGANIEVFRKESWKSFGEVQRTTRRFFQRVELTRNWKRQIAEIRIRPLDGRVRGESFNEVLGEYLRALPEHSQMWIKPGVLRLRQQLIPEQAAPISIDSLILIAMLERGQATESLVRAHAEKIQRINKQLEALSLLDRSVEVDDLIQSQTNFRANEITRIQDLIQKMNLAYDLASNFLKKVADMKSGVRDNLR